MTITYEQQMLMVNGVVFAAEQAFNHIQYAVNDLITSIDRPSVLYRPSLSIDGNKWCALYGEDIQSGVAGFGDSPAQALLDFDLQWHSKLEKAP